MAHRFKFITVLNPTKPIPTESRKLNHSHVMRQAHAKKRRLQIQKYQNEKGPRIYGTDQDLNIFTTVLSSPLYGVITNSKDPFSSLARPLTSEEYFLLNHYIQVIVPHSIGHCGLFDRPGDHQAQMLREWVGLAITDDTLMVAAVLLSTCRYILHKQPDHPVFARMALQYKAISLRTLRQQISTKSSPINAMAVAKAVALAVDEVNYGEHGIAQKHLQGALAMIQFNGGAKSLGLTGLLERMYHKFILLFRIRDANEDFA